MSVNQPGSTPTKPTLSGKIIGLAPDQPTYRILIAEDNPANRLLLNKLLSNVGFDLKEAVNGQEAVELWQQWNPHLIFMDMRMPILNGQDATKQIRALEGQTENLNGRTHILALTASAFTEQRQEMIAAGCDDFISKPFKVQEILERIAQYLQVRYLYQDTESKDVQASPIKELTDLEINTLHQMPSTWIENLRLAASQGDDLTILNLLDEIPSEIPSESSRLTQVLKSLAENFQFDRIITITSNL